MSAPLCRRLALVSMPWPPQDRPSIQLGVLKAFLLKHCPQTETETFHPFLGVAGALGSELYNRLASDGWAGEAVAAALLFPEHRQKTAHLFACQLGRQRPDFDCTVKAFENFLARWITAGPSLGTADGHRWPEFDMVGFSVCFNQLLSSLLAASMLKKSYPQIKIVFGGSSCAGLLGRSIKENFPCIDQVVHGEGEIPLLELCRGRFPTDRSPQGRKTGTTDTELPDLSQLPPPDYDDFFREMALASGGQAIQVTLPLEFSRGCWWNRCAFCNLNLQWRGFRKKSAAQMLEELQHLSRRHTCLDFIFCDNALPPAEALEFFDRLAPQKKQFHFFAELRAQVSAEHLARMHQGGLRTVQVGIEAFSDSLLQKMGKGSSVAQNLAIMKDAAACGMALEGNLITGFPQSSAAEVEETLEVLKLALPYRPLSAAAFFLGHGSPMDRDLAGHGIRARLQHPKNRLLFPRRLIRRLLLLVNDYRADSARQREMWRPVQQQIRKWQNFHARRRCRPQTPHALSWRDGGDFIQIRQELPDGRTLHHRLRGLSRQIYLFCDHIKKIEEIHQRFHALPEERLHDFFAQLKGKGLFYFDGSFCLSLAIAEERPGPGSAPPMSS